MFMCFIDIVIDFSPKPFGKGVYFNKTIRDINCRQAKIEICTLAVHYKQSLLISFEMWMSQN